MRPVIEMGYLPRMQSTEEILDEARYIERNLPPDAPRSVLGGILGLTKLAPDAIEMELPDELMLMLSKTDSPEDISELKLPYQTILIKGRFGERTDDGVIATTNHMLLAQSESGIVMAALVGVGESELRTPWSGMLHKTTAPLENTYRNLVQLLNHPEVKLETRLYTEKQKATRLNRGKTGAGKTKIVLYKTLQQHMKKLAQNPNLTRAHWVRGHWMRFESERYKLAKGTKKWVLPHTRGTGIAPKPQYTLR